MRIIQNPYQHAIHRIAYDMICNSLLVDAHELLIEFLQADENNDQTWQLLGMIAAVQHDGETAETLLEQANTLNPENTLTLKLLGQIALEHNNPEKATQWLTRAKRLAPEDNEINAALGWAYSLLGKSKKASVFFAKTRSEEEQRPEFLFNAALFDVNDGRLKEAEATLHRVILLDPMHLEARVQLIAILKRQGRTNEAVDFLRSVIAQEPENEAFLIELAEALFEERKESHREEILALAGRNWLSTDCLVRSLYLMGKLHEQENKFTEAEQYFEAANKLSPMNALVRLAFGDFFLKRRSYPQAFTQFIAAHGCAAHQEDALTDALLGVARCAYASGAPGLGEAFLMENMESMPDDKRHALILRLANQLISDKLPEAAEKYLRQLVEAAPKHRVAHELLAQALNNQDKTDASFDFLVDAVKRFPRSYFLHFQLSVAALRIGEYELGITHIQRALKLKKKNYEARGNLAVLLAESGQPTRALHIYNTLFEEDPEHYYADQLRMNRSITLMARGHAKEGLKEYNVRHKLFKNRERHQFEIVSGNAPSLIGKKVLVICEQGIGDEILFVQFVPELLAEGARAVTVEVTQKLLPLFRRSFPEITFISRQKQAHPMFKGDFDCQIAIGDLMERHYLKHDRFAIPRRPFLVPDKQRVAYWRKRLDALKTEDRVLNVGIAWRSSLQTGRRKQFWPPIEEWLRLMCHDKVNWITLQYDHNPEELAKLESQGTRFHTFHEVDQFDDIDEVAALSSALDLVISAPVSVPMISGAVGTRSWAMEPRFEWSLFGSKRIPIMPFMRPFIRGYREGWDVVVDRLITALDKEVEANKMRLAR